MMTWILFLGGLYAAIALCAFTWLRRDPFPYANYWHVLALDFIFATFWPFSLVIIVYLIINGDLDDDVEW